MNNPIVKSLVSTIIPVYNRADLIVASVESVLAQRYRPIEIIVVDDGSTDTTPSVLQTLAAQYPEIQVIRQSNAGPGAAREAGRQVATGEFIQYHDSDDLLLPSKFTSQVAALKSHPNADLVYGKTQRRRVGDWRVGDTVTGQALKGTGEQHRALFPLCLRQRWWSTSTPLHRRSVTDQAGAWLTTWNEEDWEYDCRIASLGGRLAFVDEFVSITQSHDQHLSHGGTIEPAKLIDRCRARTAMFKHAQAYMRLANRPSDIHADDWQFFSKAVFLLARECATANLVQQAKDMLQLSIQAQGYKTHQHKLFLQLTKLLGWRGAAKTVTLLGR